MMALVKPGGSTYARASVHAAKGGGYVEEQIVQLLAFN